MLILGRRAGESIMLTGGISIIIINIDDKGRQVKLGIEAPDDVTIVRTEIAGVDKHGNRKNETT